jgi:hypothetical protein
VLDVGEGSAGVYDGAQFLVGGVKDKSLAIGRLHFGVFVGFGEVVDFLLQLQIGAGF